MMKSISAFVSVLFNRENTEGGIQPNSRGISRDKWGVNSNSDPMVLVVPLARDTPSWSTISWRDIVNVRRVFFHPVGGRGYPKEPAEALAFRYDGHLQGIVEIDEVITVPCRSELARFVPEIDGEACRVMYDEGKRVPHFVYKLKKTAITHRTIPSGRVFQATKVKALLSLLQTCDTISEAATKTRERQSVKP